MTRVLVFGVFDKLHEGHKYFLEKASELGTELIVSMASEASTVALKDKKPSQTEEDRMRAVKSLPYVNEVVKGDDLIGAYSAIKEYNPNVIATGYDQNALRDHLNEWLKKDGRGVKIEIIDSFEPRIYKSSLLTD